MLADPKTKTRKHSTPEERNRFIEAWKASPLKLSEFCRQEGLSPQTLYSWMKKKPPCNEKQKQSFVSLGQTPDRATSERIEVVLPNGFTCIFTGISTIPTVLKIIRELANVTYS